MRTGVFIAGIIMMIIGAALFFSTASEPIEIFGIKIGSQQISPTLNIGGLEIPLQAIGGIIGFLGFIVFIVGLAASPD